MTDAEFQTWANSPDAVRCVLVEAVARVSSTETTRYLSSSGYVTTASDTPAHTVYEPCIVGGVSVTERLPLEGSASLGWGDIEVDNTGGVRDSWLSDIWAGRTVSVFVGDPRWPRSDFRPVFSGIAEDIGSRSEDRLNILLRDKSQSLNDAIIETTIGGTGPNKDEVVPLCFGEVHNVTPVLTDPGTLTYKVHNGAIEQVIEVRDNGVPVSFTPTLASGTFMLAASPVGTVTASVQGSKPGGTYLSTVGALIKHIVTTYGKTPLVTADLDVTQIDAFDAANTAAVGIYMQDKENLLDVCQRLAASVGAQVAFNASGKLQILRVSLPASGTPTTLDASGMVDGTLQIADTPAVRPAIKLAYCRNYTVQAGLQTGLPAEHLDMYGKEWLYALVKDQTTADNWKMTTNPEAVETLLQSRTHTETEATRRQSLWGVRRLVLRLEAFGSTALVNLGAALTLTHSRFGLSGGKTGQVISKTVDWLTHKVTLEVLI